VIDMGVKKSIALAKMLHDLLPEEPPPDEPTPDEPSPDEPQGHLS